jgi:hypothetical protein
MIDNGDHSGRPFLKIGSALAITATIPLASLISDGSTAEEKLLAFRQAAQAGQITLLSANHSTKGTVFSEEISQQFDNSFSSSPPFSKSQ